MAKAARKGTKQRAQATGQAQGFREQMIALQREVFVRNQQRISRAVFGYTEAYRRYELEYQRRVKRYDRTATFEELLTAVQAADLIYVGDYHTLEQAQRTVLRLLRNLPINLRPTLALEFTEGRYQSAVDDYLAGQVQEATFLRRIHHDPHGVFGQFAHFRPIFEFARAHCLPMVAIDSEPGSGQASLKRRDAYAATRIADALIARPGHKVIVQIGELHVTPEHLPRVVTSELAKRGITRKKTLVIYQNCEEIYWQLEAQRLEHDVEVVRVRAREYCLINTPPIICQQSFLNWLDADDEMFEDAAPEKIFKEYVAMIARVLGIVVGDELDNVVVSSVIDPQFLDILRRRGHFTRREQHEIRRQVLRSESYFIPKANMVYLGSLSVNHAAEEASHFLRHLSGGDDEPRYLVDAFYFRVLNEGIGFLGSKLINHKRKCPHERDFARLLKQRPDGSTHDPFVRQIAHYVVQHRRMERGLGAKGLREVYSSDVDMFNAVTHALGYMLGDRLYYALVNELISKSDVRDLFYDNFEEEGAALSTYLALSSRVEKVKIPSRVQ